MEDVIEVGLKFKQWQRQIDMAWADANGNGLHD
jgi:hypothetical protein